MKRWLFFHLVHFLLSVELTQFILFRITNQIHSANLVASHSSGRCRSANLLTYCECLLDAWTLFLSHIVSLPLLHTVVWTIFFVGGILQSSFRVNRSRANVHTEMLRGHLQ